YQPPRWVLRDIRRTDYAADGSSRTSRQAQADWQVSLTPDFLAVASATPDQLRLDDLREFATYLRKQALDAGAYELQFWKK
ncbi:MAG: LptF/LptG family permease, partial [Perlucidibaca sp.]